MFTSIVTYSRYKSFFKKLFNLETQNLKLQPRNSILDSQKHRVSRIEFRVETVNLHLTGTVIQLFFYMIIPTAYAQSPIQVGESFSC